MSEFLTLTIQAGADPADLSAVEDVRAGAFAGRASVVTVELSAAGRLYYRLPDGHEPYRYRLRPYSDAQLELPLRRRQDGAWETVSELPSGSHPYRLEIVPEGTTREDTGAATPAAGYSFTVEDGYLVITSPSGAVTHLELPSGSQAALPELAFGALRSTAADPGTFDPAAIKDAGDLPAEVGRRLYLLPPDAWRPYLESLRPGTLVRYVTAASSSWHELHAAPSEYEEAGLTWIRLDATAAAPWRGAPADGEPVSLQFLEAAPSTTTYRFALDGDTLVITPSAGEPVRIALPHATSQGSRPLTGVQVAALLEGLQGAARLDYGAIRNTPAIPPRGLSQEEVAAAIAHAVSGRLVPAYGDGDAGQALRVTEGDGGTVARFAPDPPAPVRTAAAPLEIDDGEISLDVPAAKQALGVVDAPERGNALPRDPHVGERYILLRRDEIPTDREFALERWQDVNKQIHLADDVFSYVYGYSLGSSGPIAALAGHVYLVTSAPEADDRAAKLRIEDLDPGTTDPVGPREFAVAQAPTPGFPHWYQVQGLTFASIDGISHRARVNVQRNAGTWLYPPTEYAPGDYTYSGPPTSPPWTHTPGVAASWAEQGRPDPATTLGVVQLHAGPGAGVAVQNSSQDLWGHLQRFVPTYDLDAAGNADGIILLEATLAFAARSSNTIGFTGGFLSAALTQTRLTGWTFAAALAASSEFAANAQHGLELASAVIHNRAATLGTIRLYLARDAANELGYYFHWSGASGALNFTLSSNLQVGHLP